jgi:uncharacterized protein (DUF2267 family)
MIAFQLERKIKGALPVQSSSSGVAAVRVPARRRHRTRPRHVWRISAAHVVWSGILRILQRVVHHKKTDRRDFKINFSVRDVLAESSRAVKAQFDALVQAVQKAGKYPAKEEAARAVHAVMEALKEKVPPDVLSRVADSLQLKEAARRLHIDGKSGQENVTAVQSAPVTEKTTLETKPADK